MEKKEAIVEAVKLMKRFHIGDEEEVAAQYPFTYSGGMKQRAMIAMGIIAGADMILADEPTGALDSRTGREVLDFLKKLNEEGNTIVMITHDSSIALEAKRVVRIHDGKINFDGDVKKYAAII